MFVYACLGVSEDTYAPQHVCGGPTTTMSCSSLCTLYELESLLYATVDTRLAGWRAVHIHCPYIWLYVGFKGQAQVLMLVPQIFYSLRTFSRLPEAKQFLKVSIYFSVFVYVCLNVCLCTACIRSLQKSSDLLGPKVEMVNGSELSSGAGN